jgi:hypothetical protein
MVFVPDICGNSEDDDVVGATSICGCGFCRVERRVIHVLRQASSIALEKVGSEAPPFSLQHNAVSASVLRIPSARLLVTRDAAVAPVIVRSVNCPYNSIVRQRQYHGRLVARSTICQRLTGTSNKLAILEAATLPLCSISVREPHMDDVFLSAIRGSKRLFPVPEACGRLESVSLWAWTLSASTRTYFTSLHHLLHCGRIIGTFAGIWRSRTRRNNGGCLRLQSPQLPVTQEVWKITTIRR